MGWASRSGARWAVLVLLAGCGGGGDPVSLLSETFGAPAGGPSDLTTRWLVTSGTTCTASNTDSDVAGSLPQGNPTFGLVLRCQGDITSLDQYSSLRSIDTWVLDRPMTFAADARVDAVMTGGIDPQPGMDITLEPLNGGIFLSKVTVRTSTATYAFKSGGSYAQVTQTYPADTLFHRYTFAVDGAGGAEWRRDGALQANTRGFPTATGDLYLKLRAPPSSAAVPSEGHVDNVVVSAP